MKKRILAFFLISIFPIASFASILKITVDAPIHPITSEYIRNTINKAEKENASLVIIVFNTPGGLDSSMREIIQRILSSKTPVVSFVSPSGARAASAGFFISIACDIFVMAPGTNTGVAHPVAVSLTGQSMDKTMEEKATNDAAAYIITLAEKRGRNTKLAEDAVRKSRAYTENEALKGNLIDLIAKNEQEIIEYFDGKHIKRFDGEEELLELKDEKITDIPMSARQKFLITISNPNLAYILLMLG
ncbi:MAG: nodulation protein NfeD, partial [Candidatus Aminicenantes bacterium]|nr:nodulation protein NfeD [Candidatus Aminicenantes bacterium]